MRSPRPKKIAVLATKEYHCLGDLLLRHANGDLNAQICAVLSNHEVLGDPCARSTYLSTAYLTLIWRVMNTNACSLSSLVSMTWTMSHQPKHMRILSPDFVRAFAHRIINIHHSFLPAFIGANPYRQAFERGVKIIGATAHFVTDDLDEDR